MKDAMERGRNIQGEGLKQEWRAQQWGEGLVPPRVIRERVSTWSEKWAGWMALGPLWLGHLLICFSSFNIFLVLQNVTSPAPQQIQVKKRNIQAKERCLVQDKESNMGHNSCMCTMKSRTKQCLQEGKDILPRQGHASDAKKRDT